MTSPVFYSTNPWFATDVSDRYRGGVYFAWVCECFDTKNALPGSAALMIAPSSNPRRIYQNLAEECHDEEENSPIIKGHRKTFIRLAKEWYADGSITKDQSDEIMASARARGWRIWRPVLYVIPIAPIIAARRLQSVRRSDRAGHGPEQQILDLRRDEFDIIEFALR
jgi:hypothetical protein